MKTLRIFILSLLAFFMSCEQVDFSMVCQVNDPATELEWLKELIENRQDGFQDELSYVSFIFDNNIYIQDIYCGNKLIQWSSTYFDCTGKEKNFNSEDFEKINLLERKLIWKGTACD